MLSARQLLIITIIKSTTIINNRTKARIWVIIVKWSFRATEQLTGSCPRAHKHSLWHVAGSPGLCYVPFAEWLLSTSGGAHVGLCFHSV